MRIPRLGSVLPLRSKTRSLMREVLGALNRLECIEVEKELDRLRREAKSVSPMKLTAFDRKSFSQYGEDGILAEIFARIGVTNRTFVEFGVGDGRENNTVYLLATGWKGLWMDFNDRNSSEIKRHFSPYIEMGSLVFLHTMVTPENVDGLIASAKIPVEADLLSIDIDGDDYYVWDSLKGFRPRVVVCEYNATFGPLVKWRAKKGESSVALTSDFGASLSSLTELANHKGYELVGCCLGGVNAFFVRRDLVGDKLFDTPFTPQRHYEPARYYLYRKYSGHPSSFSPGIVGESSLEWDR